MQNSAFSFPVRKKLLIGLAAVLQHAAIAQFPDRAQQPVSNDLFEIAAEEDLFTSFSLLLNELLDGVISSQQMENSSAIHTAKEYIAENFRRDISLNEIAAHCSLSNCYFSKLFKQHMEVNVIEYITYMRIRESKKLLIETDLSIKEIGSAIGYSDANYFARVFKRVEQLSPRAYRNKKIQKQQHNADASKYPFKTPGNTQ